MTVCRRINYFPPKVVTITVFIYCEPFAIPKFDKWDLYDEGEFSDVPFPEKKSKNGIKDGYGNNKEEMKKTKKKKKKKMVEKEKEEKQEQDVPHTSELEELVDVSFGVTNMQNKTNYINSEVVFRSGNYCSGTVQIKTSTDETTIEKSTPPPPSTQLQLKKSKKKETPPRYRVIEFKESTINVFIEMEKQNVGEFVWDQNSTRIDALVVPIPELDRTTTPEIPIHVHILP